MPNRSRRRRSPSRLAPILFFLVGCLFLTLAVTLFGAWFFFRNAIPTDSFTWKPPLDLVDNRALAPATVLLPLTGIEPADALSATLDKGHLENAFALLAYDPSFTDAARIGALLQLGARYHKATNDPKATACFQAAATLATISPMLSDQTRMDTYQQASAGLRDANANGQARLVIDQAYLVAQSSSALKRDARARRLSQVADNYAALGANALADQARQKSIEAGAATTDEPNVPTRVPFSPGSSKLPASPELDAAIKTRVAAAQQLTDDLSNLPAGSTNWASDSLSQLSDALVNEDGARQAYYAKQIPATKDAAIKIALLRDRVNWLALKYRVARGAFGKNLVDEWSKDPGSIADAWGDAWAEWFSMTENQAAAVAKPQDPNQATEDVVRQELIAARWGWNNRAVEADLIGALSDVTQRLMKAPASALHLDTLTRSGKIIFLLVPDDLYGQGDKAMPK